MSPGLKASTFREYYSLEIKDAKYILISNSHFQIKASSMQFYGFIFTKSVIFDDLISNYEI